MISDRDQRTLPDHTGQTEVKQEPSLHQQPDVGTHVQVKSGQNKDECRNF